MSVINYYITFKSILTVRGVVMIFAIVVGVNMRIYDKQCGIVLKYINLSNVQYV